MIALRQRFLKMTSLEKTPRGIKPCSHITYSMDQVRLSDNVHVAGGRHHQNTFAVEPKHVSLPAGGVRFNVETVPEPLPEHRNKAKIGRKEELERIRDRIVTSHNKQGFGNKLQAADVRIEATSEHDPSLIYQGGNGFIVAVVTAFAQHLPLELSPDHIWSLITYAFAKHVDQNAEALRKNFVSHQGKQRIEIVTPAGFKVSDSRNPDTGASAKEWEMCVFSQFSGRIKEYIGENTHAALTADFSTTTPSARAASEIVLMAAMKNYFSYGMTTLCGIPEITLLGTESDWVALRERAVTLGNLMLPEYQRFWMPALLPVLDKFVQSYRGQVDHGFWQSMVKLRHNGMGSGHRDFIGGWIQILFPYLSYGRGSEGEMRQWNEMYFSGPDPGAFPLIESFAPCDWNYFGTTYDLEFHAGITGVRQDPETGTVAPVSGWYVVHELPKPNAVRIEEVEKEIKALYAGHNEDFRKGYPAYKKEAWYKRIQALQCELNVLKFGENDTAGLYASSDDSD